MSDFYDYNGTAALAALKRFLPDLLASSTAIELFISSLIWLKFRSWMHGRKQRQLLNVGGKGRTVVITGAASGIGAAATVLFALKGWRVYAVDRDGERLLKLYSHPSRSSGTGELFEIEPVVVDITDKLACDALVRRFAEECEERNDGSCLSALVNCAGFILPFPALGAAWSDVERQFYVNTLAPIYLTRVCAGLLLRGPAGGSVVNVSSLAAEIGWPYQGVYSSTKAALEGFSESLRREIVSNKLNLRVSCVQPGPVRSPFAAVETARPDDFLCDVSNKLLLWSNENPQSHFAPGARASALQKLSVEKHISFESALITVSCEEVAQAIYCAAVDPSPPPTARVMTPIFRVLRVLLLTLPYAITDRIAAGYL